MNHLDGADSAQSVFPEWKSFLGTSSDEEAKSFLKKVVKVASPAAFSVYLIHVHQLVWIHVISDRFFLKKS